jgi:hypothetical protein
LEDILRKGLDQLTPEELSQHQPTTPVHANLRGKQYYEQSSLQLKSPNK